MDMTSFKWLKRIKQWMVTPVHDLAQWPRRLRYMIDLTRCCIGELRRDKTTQMAAAMTYHTLFSLLPTMVLAMVLLHSFVDEAGRERFKTTITEFVLSSNAMEASKAPGDHKNSDEGDVTHDDGGVLGKKKAVPDGRATGEVAGKTFDGDDVSRGSLKGGAGDSGGGGLGDVQVQIAEQLDELMDSLENLNFSGIGLVGLLVFLYGATALVATMEKGFNEIYGKRPPRPWYMRLVLYYAVITLSPLCLLAAMAGRDQLVAMIESQAWTSWLAGPMGMVIPLVMVWLVIFLLYALLPTAKVSARAAMIGSGVASLLIAGSIEGFRFYVIHTSTATLYGALAFLPLLLMWFYLLWLMVLFGLELTYSIQMMAGRTYDQMASLYDERRMADSSWAIPVIGLIGRSFQRGDVCGVDRIAQTMHISLATAEQLLRPLIEAGLIREVAVDSIASDEQDEASRRLDRVGRYAHLVLALPPDRITLQDVLSAARSVSLSCYPIETEPAWQAVRQLYESDQNTLADRTVADLY